jgi:hypothetical protein
LTNAFLHHIHLPEGYPWYIATNAADIHDIHLPKASKVRYESVEPGSNIDMRFGIILEYLSGYMEVLPEILPPGHPSGLTSIVQTWIHFGWN